MISDVIDNIPLSQDIKMFYEVVIMCFKVYGKMMFRDPY